MSLFNNNVENYRVLCKASFCWVLQVCLAREQIIWRIFVICQTNLYDYIVARQNKICLFNINIYIFLIVNCLTYKYVVRISVSSSLMNRANLDKDIRKLRKWFLSFMTEHVELHNIISIRSFSTLRSHNQFGFHARWSTIDSWRCSAISSYYTKRYILNI